ncbi:MAG: hypothetical protein IEMM0006_0706 [bacterium]|nr:MAG: hypothetical protein IEMM0006_0706 [bacterium]
MKKSIFINALSGEVNLFPIKRKSIELVIIKI